MGVMNPSHHVLNHQESPANFKHMVMAVSEVKNSGVKIPSRSDLRVEGTSETVMQSSNTKTIFSTNRQCRDLRFATWNVRSLNAGCFQTMTGDLEKYRVSITAVQEVRWPNEGSMQSGKFTFFYGGGGQTRNLGMGFVIHESILTALKDVKYINDRMSYAVF